MQPIDFSLVHADDAALDELGGARPMATMDDDPLLALLLSWRLDVDAEPIGGLIEQDVAVAVVRAAARKRGCA